MNRQVHALTVHFEQQVGQGAERGTLARFGGLQILVGPLHRFDKQAPVQKAVGQHFVEVARDVVHIVDVGVEREEVLAHGHGERGQRQPLDAGFAGVAQAQQEPGPGHNVKRDQRVLKIHLEGCQPRPWQEGAWHPLRLRQQHVMHGPHEQQHTQQARIARWRPCRQAPAPGPEGGTEQGHGSERARRQPEVDGFFRAAGRDIVRHARVGQAVAQVQQAHAQQAQAQHQGAAVGAVFLRDPGDAEHHAHHGDGHHLHGRVQWHIAGHTPRRVRRRKHLHQPQAAQKQQEPKHRLAELGAVGGVDHLQGPVGETFRRAVGTRGEKTLLHLGPL